ncbi:transposase [Fulvivirgaceae bacterium BMA10]|uniref:Transposase n=1 Tax=Splendidivirga corallicola TaxID=3051826 RepID=A0ABT8KV90_9BACT|nr:transposase [Fulvivirgaceae bacterium BMA10]
MKYRSKRPIEVEALLGQMKSYNRFNRFTMHGLEKASLEFTLMALVHNLRKIASGITYPFSTLRTNIVTVKTLCQRFVKFQANIWSIKLGGI